MSRPRWLVPSAWGWNRVCEGDDIVGFKRDARCAAQSRARASVIAPR
jgi:hypothetical protein